MTKKPLFLFIILHVCAVEVSFSAPQESKEAAQESKPAKRNKEAKEPAPASRPAHKVDAKNPFNVLIITIDTLRADHLGCYGYTRPTSPHIDQFAKQSAVFKNAHSTSSFTPPSHASIFTSEYVNKHGLFNWNALPDEQVTLAEVMKSRGYRTAASVNLFLLSKQNLGQGFDIKHEKRADKEKDDEIHDARRIIADALDVLREDTTQPFFMWLHFYDVHSPYGRQPNWTYRFNAGGRPGVGEGRQYNMFPQTVKQRGLSEADLQFIADRYDAGIAYVDSQLGPLFDELSTPERLKDTLVIVTADHGENLLDHRERIFSHDPFLYGVVTHVPLIIRFPAAQNAGLARDTLVSLIDIAPTVLDTVGIPAPATFQGLSLLPLMTSELWPRQEIFMEAWGWQQQVKKAARTSDRLIMNDLKANQSQVFDLSKDARELSPLSSPDSATQALRERLDAFIQAAGNPTAPEFSDVELPGVGANPYVGSGDESERPRKPKGDNDPSRPLTTRPADASKDGTRP